MTAIDTVYNTYRMVCCYGCLRQDCDGHGVKFQETVNDSCLMWQGNPQNIVLSEFIDWPLTFSQGTL